MLIQPLLLTRLPPQLPVPKMLQYTKIRPLRLTLPISMNPRGDLMRLFQSMLTLQATTRSSSKKRCSIVTDYVDGESGADPRRMLHEPQVVVHHLSAIVSDLAVEFWALSCCEHFPYGRGRLNESRKVAIGVEEYVRFCL